MVDIFENKFSEQLYIELCGFVKEYITNCKLYLEKTKKAGNDDLRLFTPL